VEEVGGSLCGIGWISVYKDSTTASTLSIEPGVTVKFAQNTGMQVGSTTAKGNLVAKGTATNKIVFTSNQTTPTRGFWSGISFYNDTARQALWSTQCSNTAEQAPHIRMQT